MIAKQNLPNPDRKLAFEQLKSILPSQLFQLVEKTAAISRFVRDTFCLYPESSAMALLWHSQIHDDDVKARFELELASFCDITVVNETEIFRLLRLFRRAQSVAVAVLELSNGISVVSSSLRISCLADCLIRAAYQWCYLAHGSRFGRGGDYVIALKGNQGQLNEEVKSWFFKAERDDLTHVEHSIDEHTDSGHGRIETRKCTQLEMDTEWLSEADKWTSIKTVICVESERHIDEKLSKEKRYYISSLPLNAKRLNAIIRNHWGVENSLHWTLDMTFREDHSRIRRGNAAEVMNLLRKLALNIVKSNSTRKASMKRKLKMAALDDDFRAELLLGVN